MEVVIVVVVEVVVEIVVVLVKVVVKVVAVEVIVVVVVVAAVVVVVSSPKREGINNKIYSLILLKILGGLSFVCRNKDLNSRD